MIAGKRRLEIRCVKVGPNAADGVENERIEAGALGRKWVVHALDARPHRIRAIAIKWSCDTRCGETFISSLSARSDRSAK